MTEGGDTEWRQQWALVSTPLGQPWSGRARYAAAMYFYRKGVLSADALEVYRICSRLDHEDPLPIIRERKADKSWLERFGKE